MRLGQLLQVWCFLRTGRSCLQKVGFFNQQYADQLNMEETATEYLMRNFNLPYQDGRKCLGRFGLESHAHTIQISKLSGSAASSPSAWSCWLMFSVLPDVHNLCFLFQVVRRLESSLPSCPVVSPTSSSW